LLDQSQRIEELESALNCILYLTDNRKTLELENDVRSSARTRSPKHSLNRIEFRRSYRSPTESAGPAWHEHVDTNSAGEMAHFRNPMLSNGSERSISQPQRKLGRLSSDEAKIFIDAAGMMADELAVEMSGGKQTTYGVRFFDRRERGQRLRLLAEVLPALVDPKVPAPVLTAYIAGTVEAIVTHINDMVREEIESEVSEGAHPAFDTYSWRRVVRPCVSVRSFSLKSVDHAAWRTAIRTIGKRVLGNHTDSRKSPPLGVDRVRGDILHEQPAVDDSYYMTFPKSPDVEEISLLWQRLRALTHCESAWR